MELILQRIFQTNNATIGVIHGLPFKLFTLEDAWRDNQRNISCIPAGEYMCKPHGWEEGNPFRFKRTWEITNVPDRSAILIHAGNNHQNTEGCVLVGLSMYAGQKESHVAQSRDALDMIRDYIGESDFKLVVRDYA